MKEVPWSERSRGQRVVMLVLFELEHIHRKKPPWSVGEIAAYADKHKISRMTIPQLNRRRSEMIETFHGGLVQPA